VGELFVQVGRSAIKRNFANLNAVESEPFEGGRVEHRFRESTFVKLEDTKGRCEDDKELRNPLGVLVDIYDLESQAAKANTTCMFVLQDFVVVGYFIG